MGVWFVTATDWVWCVEFGLSDDTTRSHLGMRVSPMKRLSFLWSSLESLSTAIKACFTLAYLPEQMDKRLNQEPTIIISIS